MWSETAKKLGRTIDELQSELAKVYRNKGGSTEPLVKKTAAAVVAVFEFIEATGIFDEVVIEIEKRKTEMKP